MNSRKELLSLERNKHACLVHFDHVHLVQLEPRASQDGANRLDGPDSHDGGIAANHIIGHETCLLIVAEIRGDGRSEASKEI